MQCDGTQTVAALALLDVPYRIIKAIGLLQQRGLTTGSNLPRRDRALELASKGQPAYFNLWPQRLQGYSRVPTISQRNLEVLVWIARHKDRHCQCPHLYSSAVVEEIGRAHV